MPIQEDFCKGDKKPIGKIALDDGENFHWVWPSQGLVEASKDEKVLADYKKHKEKMVPLGITGTMVANDWDASKDEKVLADYKKHGEKMEKLGITGTMVAK